MSLLLLLSTNACSVVNVSLPGHGGKTCDTADSGDAADTDTDTDADTDTDTDADSGTHTGGEAPTWAPSAPVLVAEGQTGTYPIEYVLAMFIRDTNDDGRGDIIKVNAVYQENGSSAVRIDTFPGQADGSVGLPDSTNSAELGVYSWGPGGVVAIADMDLDGKDDIVVGGSTGTLSLFTARRGGFSSEVVFPTGGENRSLLGVGAADLDGDGAKEIVAIGYDWYDVESPGRYVVLGHDSAGALAVTVNQSDYQYIYPYGVAAMDRTGTGVESLVFSNAATTGATTLSALEQYTDFEGNAYLYLNCTSQLRFSVDSMFVGFAMDVNGDGLDELISTGTDGLQMGSPTEYPVFLRINDFEGYSYGLDHTDLDGDGLEDVAELVYHYEYTDHSSYSSTRLSWNLQDGEGGFSDNQHFDIDEAPYSGANGIAAGDVNGDGCGDLAFLNGYSDLELSLGVCGG